MKKKNKSMKEQLSKRHSKKLVKQLKGGGNAKDITYKQAFDMFKDYEFTSTPYALTTLENRTKETQDWLSRKGTSENKKFIATTWRKKNDGTEAGYVTITTPDAEYVVNDVTEKQYDKFYETLKGADDEMKKGGKAKEHQYAGTKVYLGKYRNKFVVVDAKSNELWANEYFKKVEDAISFAKENKFDLISKEVVEWDKKTTVDDMGDKPVFSGVKDKKDCGGEMKKGGKLSMSEKLAMKKGGKTKESTIEGYLPVFPGFYNTLFQADEEMIIEDPHTYDDYDFDYKQYEQDVAKKAVETVEKWLKDFDIKIKFQELISPKYYNFSNDSINVEYIIGKDTIKKMLDYLEIEKEAFAKYIKDRYTSRDGFSSSYSSDSEEWIKYLKEGYKREHVFGSVLDFILENEGHDQEDLYYAVSDRVSLSGTLKEKDEEKKKGGKLKGRQVRLKSGAMGTREKLQNRYDDLEDFSHWSEIYNLHRRLGYDTAEEAWEDNPTIESGTNPSDLRNVSSPELMSEEMKKGGTAGKKTLKKGDNIQILGKRWFERTNGNTYHSVDVYVNNEFVGRQPYSYGYGDQYVQSGIEILREHYNFPGKFKDEKYPSMYALKEYGINILQNVSDVSRKKDLAKGGTMKKGGKTELPDDYGITRFGEITPAKNRGEYLKNKEHYQVLVDSNDPRETKYFTQYYLESAEKYFNEIKQDRKYVDLREWDVEAQEYYDVESSYARGGKIWESLDFDNIEQYFDYIHESKVNGQPQQVRDLVNRMDADQKKAFFTYARGAGYDETINWVNEKMECGGGAYAKGGQVEGEIAYLKTHPIKTKGDVEKFMKFCTDYIGIGFHPDTPFEDYINKDTDKATFSEEQSRIFNKAMEQSFEVAKKEKIDLYGIGIDYFQKKFDAIASGKKEKGGGVSDKNVSIDKIISILNNLDGNGITFEDEKEVRKELNNYSPEKLKRYSRELAMSDAEYKTAMKDFLNYLDGRGLVVEDDDLVVSSMAKGGGVEKSKEIKKRLEYIRKELRAERISYGELAELQSLAKHIDPSDVELLEAAGVPEFPDDDSKEKGGRMKNTPKDKIVPYVVKGNRLGVWELISTLDTKPSKGAAERIRNEFHRSLEPGHPNEHLGQKYRVGDVKIINQKTGEQIDFYKAPMFETFDKGGKAFVPKSAQMRKLQQQIQILEESKDSQILDAETRKKIPATIARLQAQYDELGKKISTREKMDLDNAKIYLSIPTTYKEKLYNKLREKGVKVKWKTMDDVTKVIVKTKSKLSKVYEVYKKLLEKDKVEVPSLESISSKLK